MLSINSFFVALITLVSMTSIVQCSNPKMPTKGKYPERRDSGKETQVDEDAEEVKLSYDKYLREVAQLLEKDPKIKKQLEDAHIDELKSGNISKVIHDIDPDTRLQLDEIKRREIERLRLLLKQQSMNSKLPFSDTSHIQDLLGHLDPSNKNTFEQSDLKNLILKVHKDMQYVEEQREIKFKKHEMEKELRHRRKMANLSQEDRIEAERVYNDQREKRKNHEKIKRPGSKDQLEDVWVESDDLEKDQFNSRTFFSLHDMNFDLYWDPLEIEALFVNEADKIYNKSASDYDPVERSTEIGRMRNSLLQAVDVNNDMLISREEFETYAKKTEFKESENEYWDTIEDRGPNYTEEELLKFEEEFNANERQEGLQ